MDKKIRIGSKPGHTIEKFENRKITLNSSKSDWQFAVEIFESRFRERYLNALDLLLKTIDKQSGFIIMSINTILIETLIHFYYGLDGSDDQISLIGEKNGIKINKKVKLFEHHSKLFATFFENSEFFKNTPLTQKEVSNYFYTSIRCGLLHQMEIKGHSKINNWQKTIVTEIKLNGKLVGLDINRTKFYNALSLEIQKYSTRLLDFNCSDDFNNIPINLLRKNFLKKLNLLCKNDIEIN